MKAEVVYSPMVAAPQEYQYNAEAFEAGGVDEVKQKATHTITTYEGRAESVNRCS